MGNDDGGDSDEFMNRTDTDETSFQWQTERRYILTECTVPRI